MPRRAVIACVCMALSWAASAESPEVRAARFYAAGLEIPLAELRRGALLVDVCTRRLRRACTKEQRQLAASSRTLALLDELTLFALPPADGFARIGSAKELAQRIASARSALVRAAHDYDVLTLARYGAALRVCPGDSGANYRESLDALTDVDLREFQGLDGAAYDTARRAIADAESQIATTVRALPAPECDATLALGGLLMEMMTGKLEPWTREHRRVANQEPRLDFDAPARPPADEAPTPDLAISVAGNFVVLVAAELQMRVFPDTAPRIKALADAPGT